MKGQTAASSYKPAILNSIQRDSAPTYDSGTKIIIKPKTARAFERFKE